MRSAVSVLLTLATLTVATAAMPFAGDESHSLVIVFKDGRQQTFSMSDIARIEFRSPASQSSVGRGRFLGKWRVGDGAGGHFFVTLEPTGEAMKSMGAAHGTWTVVDGEARISWDDGWHDAIRRVGDKYQKVAFSPEKSFSDKPSNVADAENTSPQPN
ncbi:MAG TPA: hypothetical protein VNX88_22110 [Terriglobales bacterium]|jgi:hypothetical protein|nr:hypothetical protein [Terriglobales bacterium]